MNWYLTVEERQLQQHLVGRPNACAGGHERRLCLRTPLVNILRLIIAELVRLNLLDLLNEIGKAARYSGAVFFRGSFWVLGFRGRHRSLADTR